MNKECRIALVMIGLLDLLTSAHWDSTSCWSIISFQPCFLFLFILAVEPRAVHQLSTHPALQPHIQSFTLPLSPAASPFIPWDDQDSKHLPSSSVEARLPSRLGVTQWSSPLLILSRSLGTNYMLLPSCFNHRSLAFPSSSLLYLKPVLKGLPSLRRNSVIFLNTAHSCLYKYQIHNQHLTSCIRRQNHTTKTVNNPTLPLFLPPFFL